MYCSYRDVEKKQEEEFLIILSDAVCYPWAVVVHPQDNATRLTAIMRSVRLVHLGLVAPSQPTRFIQIRLRDEVWIEERCLDIDIYGTSKGGMLWLITVATMALTACRHLRVSTLFAVAISASRAVTNFFDMYITHSTSAIPDVDRLMLPHIGIRRAGIRQHSSSKCCQ